MDARARVWSAFFDSSSATISRVTGTRQLNVRGCECDAPACLGRARPANPSAKRASVYAPETRSFAPSCEKPHWLSRSRDTSRPSSVSVERARRAKTEQKANTSRVCGRAAMEAIAKHDFNATADDELSFRRSQVLKVGPPKTVLLKLPSLFSDTFCYCPRLLYPSLPPSPPPPSGPSLSLSFFISLIIFLLFCFFAAPNSASHSFCLFLFCPVFVLFGLFLIDGCPS